MDERAFDYLENASPDVQEHVIAEFKPRRFGDSDYSGAVTSFVRQVINRLAGRFGASRGPPTDIQQAMLEAFRMRYPMDDRAWDFLCSSDAEVKRRFLTSFKVTREGESDYSRLVTAFIKNMRLRDA
eukprot:TRINITY_DN12040_c0_g1_i3.p7 TRINITY_DN12040_c0_g1~~TRINITY_DN12040_c0_g1_i3.p7  ORF type:complete len:127 (+),score=32.55 TRINITY_DN12040_c0_g1_i3:1390-1770(+)